MPQPFTAMLQANLGRVWGGAGEGGEGGGGEGGGQGGEGGGRGGGVHDPVYKVYQNKQRLHLAMSRRAKPKPTPTAAFS